jgi:hypothetical protein
MDRRYELVTVLITVLCLWAWDYMDEITKAENCAGLALCVVMFFIVRPALLKKVARMDEELRRVRDALGRSSES